MIISTVLALFIIEVSMKAICETRTRIFTFQTLKCLRQYILVRCSPNIVIFYEIVIDHDRSDPAGVAVENILC